MLSSQLRARLEQLEKEFGDQEVITEGCDCNGASGDVLPYSDHFYITRDTPEEAEEKTKKWEANAAAWRERDEELKRKFPGMLP